MKILLLNAPPLKRFGIVGQIYPPLGILYLAAYLKKISGDFEIQVVDGYQERNLEEVVKKIIRYSPEILGISFTTQAATGAYLVINQIRRQLPKIFIVVGGPHVTALPEESLIRSAADLVVLGEGEVTFSQLVGRIKGN
jgi:radical SAM superfamily enzyme YgiQ (UPF0313 family)